MPSWVVVGPGDDAAVIEPERGRVGRPDDRRAGRRRALRSSVRAAGGHRAPGPRRESERFGGHGRQTSGRAALARAPGRPGRRVPRPHDRRDARARRRTQRGGGRRKHHALPRPPDGGRDGDRSRPAAAANDARRCQARRRRIRHGHDRERVRSACTRSSRPGGTPTPHQSNGFSGPSREYEQE